MPEGGAAYGADSPDDNPVDGRSGGPDGRHLPDPAEARMRRGRPKGGAATDPAQPRKITIRDVAERAGVGVGTVSRVLNDHPSVSSQMRARIRAVMAGLDYRPDRIAQDLGRRFTKCLGVVVPDLANPFFAELVQALEQAARAEGYNLFLTNSTEDPRLEAACVDSLCRRRIDGLFLIRCQKGSADYAGYDLPVIHVDRLSPRPKSRLPVPPETGAAADHAGGMALGLDHLIGLGHRRIALLAGEQSLMPARLRHDSYLRIMAPLLAQEGIATADYIAAGRFDLASGEAGLRRLMALPPEIRPSAVAASSDQQAIGAMRAARELGLSIPRDLSLLGFDGLPVAAMITPRLTTIEQPVTEIAKAAFALFAELAGRGEGKAGRPRQVVLPCRLRLGKTTGPAPVRNLPKPSRPLGGAG